MEPPKRPKYHQTNPTADGNSLAPPVRMLRQGCSSKRPAGGTGAPSDPLTQCCRHGVAGESQVVQDCFHSRGGRPQHKSQSNIKSGGLRGGPGPRRTSRTQVPNTCKISSINCRPASRAGCGARSLQSGRMQKGTCARYCRVQAHVNWKEHTQACIELAGQTR